MPARHAGFLDGTPRGRRWCWPAIVFAVLWIGFAEAETPDFSTGFRQLQALGLPDLKGATWVRDAQVGRSGGGDYLTRQLFQKANGNAWRLPDGSKIIGAGALEAQGPSDAAGRGGRILLSPGRARDESTGSAAPATDVQALIDALKGGDKEEEYFLRSARNSPEVLGRLFLLAAQFHSAGHTAEANRLAAAVLTTPADATMVIDSAVSMLANERCRLVLEAFYQQPDWKSLASQLDSVVSRFSRGWSNRDTISGLSFRIKAQVRDGVPPLIAPLEPVPESLTRAVEAWLAGEEEAPDDEADEDGEESGEDDDSSLLWTLPSAPKVRGVMEPAFLGEGVTVLAVLIPALADTTLLAQPDDSTSESTDDFLGAFRSNIVQATYRLPATRANLVEPLVRMVIPDSSEMGTDALAAAAAAFWKIHARKPPVELAALYLNQGDDDQQSAAARWLSKTSATGAEEAFTAWSTAPAHVVRRLAISKEYIRQRGKAAAGLVEELASALRQNAGQAAPAVVEEEYDSFGRTQPLDAKMAESVIRSLQVLISGKSLAESLTEIATAAEPAGPVLDAMQSDIHEAPVEEALPAVLQAAAAATTANRPDFMQAGLVLAYMSDRIGSSDHANAPLALSDIANSVKEPLLALLDTQEIIPPEKRGRFGVGTIAHAAALVEARLSEFPMVLEKTAELHALTGEPAMDFLRQRALARLKQQPVPEWPDAGKVEPGRLKEIIASLDGLPPLEIIKTFAALSLDERAALVAWMGKPEDPPWLDSLQAMRTVIHRAQVSSQYGPIPFGSKSAEVGAAAGFRQGDTLSVEFIESRAKALLQAAAGQPPLIVMLRPANFKFGWNMIAFTADPEADGTAGELIESPDGRVPLKSLGTYFRYAGEALGMEEAPTAIATLWIYRGQQQTSHWLLQPDGAITTSETGKPESSALEALDELLTSENDENNTVVLLTFITRAHLQAIKGDDDQ